MVVWFLIIDSPGIYIGSRLCKNINLLPSDNLIIPEKTGSENKHPHQQTYRLVRKRRIKFVSSKISIKFAPITAGWSSGSPEKQQICDLNVFRGCSKIKASRAC